MYTQDYDGRLPLMKDHESLKRVLMPYTGNNPRLFVNYTDKSVLYLPNPSLSFRRLSDITMPGTVSMYESTPAGNGKRWVALLRDDAPGDRDIDFAGLKLVDQAEWRTLKRQSQIP